MMTICYEDRRLDARWGRDRQQDSPVCYCHHCGGEIYSWDDATENGIYYLCPYCAKEKEDGNEQGI